MSPWRAERGSLRDECRIVDERKAHSMSRNRTNKPVRTSYISVLHVRIRLFVVTAILFTFTSGAQSPEGEIRGVVIDPSGGAIAGARIAVTRRFTGEVRHLVTNTNGLYDAPNLTVGQYDVTFDVDGFSKGERKGIDVQVGMVREIDVQLRIGSSKETVTVLSDSDGVDLATARRAAVDTGSLIRELPLNGRDWITLAALQPEVTLIRTENPPTLDVNRGNRGYGEMLTIGGQRPQESTSWIDGINVNDYAGGPPGSVMGAGLGVDAIEEFSVVTENPTADLGRTAGGVINAVTREGGNKLHGSAYEFLRNSAVDARNYFDGASIPAFRRNQFGGTMGGPVCPGKSFFFVNYEGLRQALGITTIDVVPSVDARAGNLVSGTVPPSPSVVPYLQFFPLPNGAATGDTATYSFAGNNDSSENFVASRADYRVSNRNSLRGTYLFDTSNTEGPDTFNGVVLGKRARRQTGSLEEAFSLAPNAINQIRIGVNRDIAEQVRSVTAINPLAADPEYGFLPGRDVGEITIAGLTQYPGGLGASGDYQFHYTSLQGYDDFSFARGGHSLKVGAAIERIQSNAIGAGTNNGNVNFGSLVSFLSNAPQSFIATIPGTNVALGMRQWVGGGYMEDNWRVLQGLTFSLGVRYEFSTVPSEAHNRLATLVPGMQTLKEGGSLYQNPTLRDFSPRFGIAWDPFGDYKTAVHAAFGQYDYLPLTSQFSLISVLSAPFSLQGASTSIPIGSFPRNLFQTLAVGGPRADFIEQKPGRSYVLQWNVTVQRQITADLLFELGYEGAHGVRLPLIENDINTATPQSSSVLGYFWPTPRGTGAKPWPSWGIVTGVMWNASSTFNAFSAAMTRRYRRGLQLQLSYSWSKSLDIGSNSLPTAYTNTVSNLPYFAQRLLRSVSDFDVPQTLVLSGTWELDPSAEPGIRRRELVLSGWELGSLFTASSGQPFTTTIAGDPLGLNSSIPYDFPDLVNEPGCGHPVNAGNPTNYIKLSCFAAPSPSTRLGDAGRNDARGPGLVEWDASVFKNVPLSELSPVARLQLRLETFNALNRANFNPPSSSSVQLFTQVLTPITSAGKLTSTSTTSRQLQLGLKLFW